MNCPLTGEPCTKECKPKLFALVTRTQHVQMPDAVWINVVKFLVPIGEIDNVTEDMSFDHMADHYEEVPDFVIEALSNTSRRDFPVNHMYVGSMN